MKEVKMIDENFEWDKNIPFKCYRVFAEENGQRSIDTLLKFVNLDIKIGKYFCGTSCFYQVPQDATNSQFTFKYGDYFNNFETYFLNPKISLMKSIEDFNKGIKLNPMYKKYNKPLIKLPIFNLSELIKDSEIVLIIEKHFSEYGPNIIFFESNNIDSKQYMIDYFKKFDIEVLDRTKS